MIDDEEGKQLIIYEKSNESDKDGSNLDVHNPYAGKEEEG